MSEMTFRRGLGLTAVLLVSLGLLFAQRLVFPLEIRPIVAARGSRAGKEGEIG
jgi:hypothetical protein